MSISLSKMKNLSKNSRKVRKNRQSKLKYSIPLLLSLFIIILCWHQFQKYYSDNNSLSLNHNRHLLESESGGDFPNDPFSKKQKQDGFIIFHCLLMLYMFLGLAKICDDYFEPTLEVLCESLEIKDDVAGATWMAAGGSAPELFTSIIGVFFAKSDIGFGTIVGSAVFNVLAVISVCAYFVPNLPVTGWPLARDSVYYCFGILIIISCVEDQKVYWYEALILLIFYIVYVYIMKFNEKLQELVTNQLSSQKNKYNKLQLSLQYFFEHSVTQTIIFVAIIINVTFVIYMIFADSFFLEQLNFYISLLFIIEMALKLYCYGPLSYWMDVWNALDGVLVVLIIVEYILAQSAGSGAVRALRLLRLGRTARSFRVFRLIEQLGRVHIDTSTQTNNMAMVVNNLPQAEDQIVSNDSEIRKIEILSSSLSKQHSGLGTRPSLQSISESQSSDQIKNEKKEDSDTNIFTRQSSKTLSPTSIAKGQFQYDMTICVRKLARDGKRIVFFERNNSTFHHQNSDQTVPSRKPPRCIRLIIMPDGSRKFEEYYSVRGSRVSRSYTGNFNLAIIPVGRKTGASLSDISDNSFVASSEWRASSDFSTRLSEDSGGSEEGPIELWDWPSDEGIIDKILYLVTAPLHLLFFYTIVDTQKPMNDKYWPMSFMMCIVWIAGLSYIMVWMASEIGFTADIPEPIMGITILAAGTSIPDMLSSLAVAKKGRGDMAVSSSIGSNIFDILFGLPFPWLIKTALVSPGTYVPIESSGMTIMVLSLFLMVAFVILSIQQFAWKLSKKLSYVFAVLYILFVIEAMLIEYGVLFN